MCLTVSNRTISIVSLYHLQALKSPIQRIFCGISCVVYRAVFLKPQIFGAQINQFRPRGGGYDRPIGLDVESHGLAYVALKKLWDNFFLYVWDTHGSQLNWHCPFWYCQLENFFYVRTHSFRDGSDRWKLISTENSTYSTFHEHKTRTQVFFQANSGLTRIFPRQYYAEETSVRVISHFFTVFPPLFIVILYYNSFLLLLFPFSFSICHFGLMFFLVVLCACCLSNFSLCRQLNMEDMEWIVHMVCT